MGSERLTRLQQVVRGSMRTVPWSPAARPARGCLSGTGRFRSGEIGKNGRQPTATRPLLTAPAVAPAPTGEVTAADRDPASTGRAEVLAPARMWWNNGDGAMKDVPRDAF